MTIAAPLEDRIRTPHRLSLATLGLVGLIAVFELAAWTLPAFGAHLPKTVFLMKANTALGLLAASLSLGIAGTGGRRWYSYAGELLGAGIFSLGGVAIIEYSTGVHFAIETWLAADVQSSHSGLMSILTAIAFCLLGATRLFYRSPSRFLVRLADLAALLLVAHLLMLSFEVILGTIKFFGFTSYSQLAFQNLLCFWFIAGVQVSQLADHSLFVDFKGSGVGSRVARRVLPLALFLMILLAVARRYAIASGFLSSDLASVLALSIFFLAAYGLALFMARRANQLEAEKNALVQREAQYKLQQSEDHYRSLVSQRIIQAQDAERRMLARELHDEFGQSLTAIVVNLKNLEVIADDNELREHLVKTAEVASQLLKEARQLSLHLHPAVLDEMGLEAAMQWCVRTRFESERVNIQLEFESELPRMSMVLETTAYRIFQEALSNAIRHSGASNIYVRMGMDGGNLAFNVRDDGHGFDVARAMRNTKTGVSLGLTTMQERAELTNGMVTIASEIGKGTEVSVMIPTQEPGEGDSL